MEVLQTSALPLGYGADRRQGELREGFCRAASISAAHQRCASCVTGVQQTANEDGLPTEALGSTRDSPPPPLRGYGGQPSPEPSAKVGAGNGIRTRDFDLGKVALYH